MDQNEIKKIAQYLYDAELKRQDIDKITITFKPDLTAADAYRIQAELVNLKLADGHEIYAPKLGLTSIPKMKQMNVEDPIYGYVFDYMLVDNNDSFSISDYIHARVEPEISIVLKDDLKGPNVTLKDVEEHVDYVVSSVEILDSRYKNYGFTHPDVIADNTSARGAVYSTEAVKLTPQEIIDETAELKINGEIKVTGSGSQVLGNPLETIVFLANELAKEGKAVPKGLPIMTGGMTAAVEVNEGDVIEVEYKTLGKIKFEAKK